MLKRDEFQNLYEQGPEAVWSAFSRLQDTLVAQQQQIDTLLLQVKELQDRLGKDSHNSNKTPSSDGLKKKPVSLRQQSGRKPGGQKGHPGRTLEFAEEPHHILVHAPSCCEGCGTDLAGVSGKTGERRQVFDLPPLALEVTEHRSEQKVCPCCGKRCQGAFPQEATSLVQYGPRLKGLGLYLLDFQLLPYQRVADLFADLFDAPLSPGMLHKAQQSASERLAPVVEKIREALTKAPVAHFDEIREGIANLGCAVGASYETGFRILGRLHWLHSASTALLSYYTWHSKRGKIGMDAAGVLPHFTGRAVHDGYASYQQYACRHALCNVHHLRELTALFENEGACWARDMRHLLVEMKQAVDRARAQGRTRLPVLEEAAFEGRYQKLLQQGLAANPPPAAREGKRGRPKQIAARNLRASYLRNSSGTFLPYQTERNPDCYEQRFRSNQMYYGSLALPQGFAAWPLPLLWMRRVHCRYPALWTPLLEKPSGFSV
jgi:transposase